MRIEVRNICRVCINGGSYGPDGFVKCLIETARDNCDYFTFLEDPTDCEYFEIPKKGRAVLLIRKLNEQQTPKE